MGDIQPSISGTTRLTAVIGSPIAHSLSPALHNAAFAAAGLDWRMVAFDMPEGRVPAAIDAMKVLGLAGYAVTMPHKAAAAAAVDSLDPASAVLQSVNTISLRPDGTTFGASTDGAGFVASLTAHRIDLTGQRVVVLGAGGAARSIVDAIGREQVDDLVIVNRTRSSARSIAELVDVARVGSLVDIRDADLLVNATSVGFESTDCPVDQDLLHRDLLVADIVYHPLETELLRAARSVGAQTVDGLGMLVHQAALQQQLWTGERPDTNLMRTAAEAELARR